MRLRRFPRHRPISPQEGSPVDQHYAQRMRERAGRLRLGTDGEDLAQQLLELIDVETQLAQQALQAAVEDWTRSEVERLGGRPSDDMLRELRIAAMGAGSNSSRESLSSLFNKRTQDALGRTDATQIERWAREVADGSEHARRARNLINHRRKVVKGVLRAVSDRVISRPSSRSVSPTPEQMQRAHHLRGFAIDSPVELGRWAEECFAHYVEVQESTTRWTSTLANNHKAEWLEFIRQFEPAMWLTEESQTVLHKRSGFDERIERNLEQLRWRAVKPTTGIFEQTITSSMDEVGAAPSAPPAAPSNWRSMFGSSTLQTQISAMSAPPVAEAEPVRGQRVAAQHDGPTGTISPASPGSVQSSTSSIELVRTSQGITLVIDADAYGVQDLDETALALGLMLLDPSDPTEVKVRAIPGPPRQLEVMLGTLDPQKGVMALRRAKESLRT